MILVLAEVDENEYLLNVLPGVFHYAFVQRGALEVLLLAAGAGLLGTWIVLRGLAFYSHAVGTAAFPGLVAADLEPPGCHRVRRESGIRRLDGIGMNSDLQVC